MSKRRVLIAAGWFALAGLLLALALVFIFGVGGATRAKNDACQDALTTADARYALSESTTALVYDQWQATEVGDAHGVEYAKSGIATNQEEIDALTTDYEDYKEECK